MEQIHASCVAIDNQGVLLRGVSGAGKSDLALRLIDQGADLIADDRVHLKVAKGQLFASAPGAIAGLLEVRGIGIVQMPTLATVAVSIVIDLVPEADIERLPEAEWAEIFGFPIRQIKMYAFEPSAPAKIRTLLRYPLEK